MNSHSSQSGAIAVALTGAKGNFGRTFIAQLRCMRNMRPSVLVDLDIPGLISMLTDLGLNESEWAICNSKDEANEAADLGKIILCSNFQLCSSKYYDVLVEATGNCTAGFNFARNALNDNRHVVMVSKEVESIAGVYLAHLALSKGISYLPGLGDQPANLLELLDWVEAVGLKVIAVGKSSEYDLVYNPTTGMLSQLSASIHSPEISDLLTLDDDLHVTLEKRRLATQSFKRSAAADFCEMAVISQYSSFLPDIESLHYPIARPNELADIYALQQHGGILKNSGVTDVFSMLRLPGETSFAGGEFVIVETNDSVTWEILREKGHIVSRDGRYGCLYNPYHLLGIQTPLSVLQCVQPNGNKRIPQQYSILSGRATHDLTAGTVLSVAGHHHEIDGVTPVLRDRQTTDQNVAPFYLLNNATLKHNVMKDALITIEDIEGYNAELWSAFNYKPTSPLK